MSAPVLTRAARPEGAGPPARTAPLRIAIRIGDPVLSARFAAAIAGIPGLVLAAEDEAADAVLQAGTQADGPADARLTPREREVLRLVAEGASNKAIARALGISVHTAKFHVRSLIDKLDATGRTDAVAHAARIGVIRL
ncbi:MAG: helix-turn-helix transcriptional regulator [Rhodobacteraceae bacterium]|nr:helix-turn-helix transcriptional regulator [Paracoccaceae bacterium]